MSTPTLTLRSVTLGAGRPAVCVPVVERTPADAARVTAALPAGAADVVELRLDHLTGSATDPDVAVRAVAGVRAALPHGTPLLATFRTVREGGVQPADEDAYATLVRAVLAGGQADAVDVELAAAHRADLVRRAHDAGAAVVLSHHDFAATPPRARLLALLREQAAAGADLCKIAVMPHDVDDVLALLGATADFARAADRPAATMAMGGLGVVTRLAGEVVGSALTFGSVGSASAPGQVDATALHGVLALVHCALVADAPPPSDPV